MTLSGDVYLQMTKCTEDRDFSTELLYGKLFQSSTEAQISQDLFFSVCISLAVRLCVSLSYVILSPVHPPKQSAAYCMREIMQQGLVVQSHLLSHYHVIYTYCIHKVIGSYTHLSILSSDIQAL